MKCILRRARGSAFDYLIARDLGGGEFYTSTVMDLAYATVFPGVPAARKVQKIERDEYDRDYEIVDAAKAKGQR